MKTIISKLLFVLGLACHVHCDKILFNGFATDCSTTTSLAKIDRVDIKPDALESGDTFSFTLNLNLRTQLPATTITASLIPKSNPQSRIPVELPKHSDFCWMLANVIGSKDPCPSSPGSYVITGSFTPIPSSNLFKGSSAEYRITTSNGDKSEVLCLNIMA
ncbi:hypothetical protein BDF22DRAFT_699902 [Syncephalis plumigaleata]|nr:hypothetical protein BDF22DRAFT_699902 [Syncephalis plumigaleata]